MAIRSAPTAARRRRPRDRHGPGPRAGHRPAASAATSACRPRSWSATTRPRRSGSRSSPPPTRRGSWRCGWCPRASTSPGCASACTPPRRRPSCSSARPSAASCAGRPSAGQKAYVFIPDDPRLRTHAFQIAEARRHVLRPPGGDDDEFSEARPSSTALPATDEFEQLSLFSVAQAVATGIRCTRSPRTAWPSTRSPSPTCRQLGDTEPAPRRSTCPRSPPRPASSRGPRSVAEQKDDLRTRNADVANGSSTSPGWNHGQVQRRDEPPRRRGEGRAATIDQLERRLRYARAGSAGPAVDRPGRPAAMPAVGRAPSGLRGVLRVHLRAAEDDVDVIQARIAERLQVSRPAVSEMIRRLEAEGLVAIDSVGITPHRRGLELAQRVVRRHRLAERFLTDMLGLSWAEAHHEAGKWEHIMSDAVEEAMDRVLGSPTTCPHGNPIPGSDVRGARVHAARRAAASASSSRSTASPRSSSSRPACSTSSRSRASCRVARVWSPPRRPTARSPSRSTAATWASGRSPAPASS